MSNKPVNTTFKTEMGDIVDDTKQFIIIKTPEMFKPLLGRDVVVFTTKQMQRDGTVSKLTAETDSKGREIYNVGNMKFQFKHIIWWLVDKYIHIDGKKYPIIKLDMNRK